ncbi:MAG: hypothetical protein H7099_14335 [Gemmatimonadaceae bacterium]|nr:hypothetical protein [Gemmatimonadaceae bacterium]
MIIMALDHVRDFIHRAAMTSQPTDLAVTTPTLFFTRWITHFCAPVFMFTAGMGAYLWWQKGHSKAELSRYLLSRGLWLMLLEVTVMRLAYNFTFSMEYPLLLLVLWVLGACMVSLALLAWVPLRVLTVLSVAVALLHNTFDGIPAQSFGAAAWMWNLVHQPGLFFVGQMLVVVGYPLVPWVAVMALGFCAGRLMQSEPAVRQRMLLTIGAALTCGFVLLRAANVYGDPVRWTTQPSAMFTLLSFLNTSKYPPSLSYLLMTLGPALMVLAFLDRRRFTSDSPLVVFGRVPLFYFAAHFFLAHLMTVVLARVRYGAASGAFRFTPIPSMGGSRDLFPADFGYELWVVYVVWIGIVLALYPACRWFANIKATRSAWWLGYL